MTATKKNLKRSIIALGIGLATAGSLGIAGASSQAHLVNANADETNTANLANGKATDIPNDSSPNWHTFGNYRIDLPRANSQGEYAYCINCGKSGFTSYSGQIKQLTNGYVSNVLCDGQVQAGKQCQYAPMNQLSEPERELVTQYAIWIALGQGNVQDTGTQTTSGQEISGSVNNNAIYQQYKQYIDGLLNYAKSNAPVKTTPQDQQQKITDAQNALNKQVQDDLNNQLKTVTDQLTQQAHQEQDNDLQSNLQKEVAEASKALHINPVSVQNTQATKTKLGAKFDGDDAKGHLDDIQNGSHDFYFKITHDDTKNTNWDAPIKVHFEQQLPKDTEIWVNGKQITKDASTTQDYTMNVGDTYVVKIPFSDKSNPNSESLKATATFTSTYTAQSVSKNQNVTADKKQTIDFDNVQLGAGYKDPDNSAGQSRAVGYLIASPSTKDITAHASQDAKVTLPPKQGSQKGQAEADYSFSWKPVLGRLVVDKLGVPSDPDAQQQQQISKIETQNDFASGFNFGKKPAKISADGSDSNFEGLAPSEQKYQNGGSVTAQETANNTTVNSDGKTQTNNNNFSNNTQSKDINQGVTDSNGKVVPLSDVTFQLVPRTVQQLNVLKQYYPLADGNGSQITLPKVTDGKGQLVWDNIPYGDYDLIEVQTANGYVLNRQPIHVGADRYHAGTNHVIVENKGQGSSDQKIEIHTTAHDDTTNDNTFSKDGTFKSHDTAEISGLAKGQHFQGELIPYDSATRQQIPNTKAVTINVVGNGEGTQTVQGASQDINSKDVKGNVVYVEKGKTTDTGEGGKANVEADHNLDLTDTAETLTPKGTPSIHTTATENGGKVRTFSKNEEAVDNIAHSNFDKGTYEDIIWAVNPDTGKPVDSNAPVGTTQYTVDENGKDFTTQVHYKFDGSNYHGKIVFVEETVKVENGKANTNDVYANHKDLNDTNETLMPTTTGVGQGKVTPAEGSGSAVTPTTTPSVVNTPLQQTGEQKQNTGLVAILTGAILTTVGWIVNVFKKREN